MSWIVVPTGLESSSTGPAWAGAWIIEHAPMTRLGNPDPTAANYGHRVSAERDYFRPLSGVTLMLSRSLLALRSHQLS